MTSQDSDDQITIDHIATAYALGGFAAGVLTSSLVWVFVIVALAAKG
jgi:hypothetical protein